MFCCFSSSPTIEEELSPPIQKTDSVNAQKLLKNNKSQILTQEIDVKDDDIDKSQDSKQSEIDHNNTQNQVSTCKPYRTDGFRDKEDIACFVTA